MFFYSTSTNNQLSGGFLTTPGQEEKAGLGADQKLGFSWFLPCFGAKEESHLYFYPIPDHNYFPMHAGSSVIAGKLRRQSLFPVPTHMHGRESGSSLEMA